MRCSFRYAACSGVNKRFTTALSTTALYLLQIGNHFAPERLYKLLLVAAHVMDVYLCKPQIYEVLDVLAVGVKFGGHMDATLEVIRAYQFGHRLEVFGVADVLLGEVHAAIGPLFYRLVDARLVGVG